MARSTRTFSLLVLLACALLAPPADAAHVRCDATITQDTTLDSDLRCPGNGPIIGADGVRLDLGGHVLSTPSSEFERVGVNASHRGDVEVRNGRIEGFGIGVMTARGGRVTIDDVAFRDGGLYATDAGDVTVSNSVFERAGLRVQYPASLLLTESRVAGGDVTLVGLDGGDMEITRNEFARGSVQIYDGTAHVAGNRFAGAQLSLSGDMAGLVEQNVIAGGAAGIRVDTLASPHIERNALHGQSGDGIHVSGAAVMTGNSVHHAGGDGIEVAREACAVVERNTVHRNGGNGILLAGAGKPRSECPGASSHPRATGNHAHRNALDGIRVTDNWIPVVVAANRAERNGDDGIDVDGRGAAYADLGWSPDGDRLAVAADSGTGPAVWLIDAANSGATLLATGAQPDWSPGGDRIAFARSGAAAGIHTINVDGTGLVKLADDGTRPRWSPDGQTILFERSGELWTVPASGGSARFVAAGGDADWAPGGRQITFSDVYNVYVADADGTGLTFVDEGTDPRWSPAGDRIVYVRGTELWTIRPDATDPRSVTSRVPCSQAQRICVVDLGPDWSPGRRIAFVGVIRNYDVPLAFEIFTVNPDGTDLRQLTGPPEPTLNPNLEVAVPKQDPRWSPDDGQIAYLSGSDAFALDAAGSVPTRLTIDVNPLVTLANNRADHNSDLGLEAAEQVVEGGPNRAKHNGDPRQCLNMACR